MVDAETCNPAIIDLHWKPRFDCLKIEALFSVLDACLPLVSKFCICWASEVVNDLKLEVVSILAEMHRFLYNVGGFKDF